ncbi:MAG: sigma-70 family RNA polymerase sigma factor [Chloroflexi bacterium]|nr:MAG: sigma-70 family RNA polymerase sigma factor [Chloroflexota bacterium]
MKRHRANAFAVIEQLDFSILDEWIQDSKNALNLNLEDEVASKQVLYDAIEQLSDNQRRIVLDFYFEGRALPQIAEDLHVSVNTLYKRHFDALKQLRKIFELNQLNK